MNLMYTTNFKMADIFENTILCKKCNSKMNRAKIIRNGFILRAMVCPKCNEKIIHPSDQNEYEQFVNLKGKTFKVKLRLVGNSYAVSIPKEIVSFIKEQEKLMGDMVKLCFEQAGKISLVFNELNDEIKEK